MTPFAFKIAEADAWRVSRLAGVYAGSAADAADGYIHLSSADQLAETARRHYRGQADLVVAKVDLRLIEGVKWEPSRGGHLFPHIYGDLPMRAVMDQRSARVDDEGCLVFDDGAPAWP